MSRYKSGSVRVLFRPEWLDDDELPEPGDLDGYPRIQLPHQCDNWIIGGVDEARQMIVDLRAAILEMEASE